VIGSTPFSYLCNACGRCCHDKVITLAPYDVLGIARAAAITTREAIDLYTIRRGSILRFAKSGGCAALEGTRCGLHRGRPLACRLYPLGMERVDGEDRFLSLEPAPGSLGIYDQAGTVADFLVSQSVASYLEANARYESLLPILRERIAALVDFERVEPREFWRRASREAMAESGYDPNPLIDALFDCDQIGCSSPEESATISAHLARLGEMIRAESNADLIAATAVMLAVSLGYSPARAIDAR
jgi:Fe-S-cluster containining protein